MPIKSAIPEAFNTFILTPGGPSGPGGPGGPNPPGQGSRWEIGVYGADSQYGQLLAMVPSRLWNSFTFSKMLDDQGSATLVLAMDDPFWNNQNYPQPVQPVLVGSFDSTVSASSYTFSPSSGPAAGGVGQCLLVVAEAASGFTSLSISDSVTNSYNVVASQALSNGVGLSARFATLTTAITNATVFTVTLGASAHVSVRVYLLPVGFTAARATTTGATSATASVNVSAGIQTGSYLVTCFGNGSSAAVSTPPPSIWTQFDTAAPANGLYHDCYWQQSSTISATSASLTWGSSVPWGGLSFILTPGLVNNLLPNGLVPHFLLDEEHVWRVFQDGVARFDFLGETITEQLIDNSENRLVTITGPGTIAMLDWAIAAPPGFPGNITYKTDALSDSFSEININGQYVIDYGLWNASAPTADIAINPAGSAQLTATSGGTVLGSTQWDATNSLISASVTPIVAFPTTNTAGQTVFKDSAGNTLNGSQVTQMYVQSLDGNGYYALIGMSGSALYAQYKGPSGTFTHVIASIQQYTSSQSNNQGYGYWQISEKNGTFYFWTSGDGQTWKQQWSHVRDWAANPVGVYFSSQYTGSTTENVTISGINSDVVTSSLGGATYLNTPIVPVWLQTLQQAQARNTIPWVTTSASLAQDSFGNPWTDSQSVQIQNGTGLYSLLQGHCQMVDADYIMEPGFRLVIGIPSPTTPNSTLVTLGYDRSAAVRFHEAGTVVQKQRQRLRNQIQNLIGVINTDAVTETSTSASSIATWGQREAWVQAAAQVSAQDIQVVASAAAQQFSQEILSWTLQIVPFSPGRTVFRDFSVGDWVGLERPDFSAVDAVRVTGISVSIDQDGNETHELVLVSYIQWLEQRLQYIATKMGGGFVNANGTTTISNNAQGSTLQAPTVFSISLSQLGSNASTGGAPLVYDPASGQWIPAGSASPLTGVEVPLQVAGSGGTTTVHQGGVVVSTPSAGTPLNGNPFFTGSSLAGWQKVNATLSVQAPAVNMLAADGTFESGISGWGNTNCTIAQSSAQSHAGTQSLLVTSTATSGITVNTAFASGAPWLAGQSVTLRGWVYANQASEVFTPALQWYTSGGALISAASGTPFTPAATGTWTPFILTVAAASVPGTTAFAVPQVGASVASSGNSFYLDDIVVEVTGNGLPSTIPNAVLITPTLAGGTALAATALPLIPVQAGAPYVLTALVNLPAQSPQTVTTSISWYDVNGSPLSTSLLTTSVPASQWAQLSHQAVAPWPAYDVQVSSATPLGWWKLSDPAGSTVAVDSSGYRNNASATAVTFGQGFAPVPGNKCAQFNGHNSSLASNFYTGALSSFSAEAWVNLNAQAQQPSSSPHIVADGHPSVDFCGFELFFSSTTGAVSAVLGNGTGNSMVTSPAGTLTILPPAPVPPPLPPSVPPGLRGPRIARSRTTGGYAEQSAQATGPPMWNHLAVTWDGVNLLLYVNGAQVASTTFAGPMAPGSAGQTIIGTGAAYSGDWYAGLIGEVALYEGALTPAQVALRASNLSSPGTGTGAAGAVIGVGPTFGYLQNPMQAASIQLALDPSGASFTGTQGVATGTQAGTTTMGASGTMVTDAAGNMRAMLGVQADGTVTLSEFNAPAPQAPDIPTVSGIPLGLSITWDGLLQGQSPLSDFFVTQFHLSTTPDFVPSSATLIHALPAGGTVSVPGLTPGTLYYAKLVAVNSSGATAASIASPGLALGVSAGVQPGELAEPFVGYLGGLNSNPWFAGGSSAGWIGGSIVSGAMLQAAAPGAPFTNAYLVPSLTPASEGNAPFPVTVNQQILVTAWVFSGWPAVNLGCSFFAQAGTSAASAFQSVSVTVPVNQWVQVAAVVTVPFGMAYACPQMSTVSPLYIQGVVCLPNTPGGLSSAGTVVAAQVAAGAVIAGVVDGTIVTGATLVADGTQGQFLAYTGVPTIGNLVGSFSGIAGNDSNVTGPPGNNYPQGFALGIPDSGQIVLNPFLNQAFNAATSLPGVFTAMAQYFTGDPNQLMPSMLGSLLLGQVVPNPNDDANGGSLTGWTGFNGALTATSSPPAGCPTLWSFELTGTTTTSASIEGTGQPFSATVSTSYIASAWVYSSSGSAQVGFDWLLNGSFVSTSTTVVSVPVNTWTQVSYTVNSPGSAINQGYVRVGPNAIGATMFATEIVGSAAATKMSSVMHSPFNTEGACVLLQGVNDGGTDNPVITFGTVSMPDGMTMVYTPIMMLTPYALVLYSASSGTTVVTKTSGSGTIPIPVGVSVVKGEAWGGGSSGLSGAVSSSGFRVQSLGGAGGEYSCEPSLAVTGGGTVSYSVGAGGAQNTSTFAWNAGSNTTLTGSSVTVTAHGATSGGVGGSGSTNTLSEPGGNSISNDGVWNGANNFAMGGGSSGGTSSPGNNSPGGQGTAGGNGATAPSGGGAGGKGGTSSNGATNGVIGAVGVAPGGGGGGGGNTATGASGGHGAAGAAGQVRVTYTSGAPVVGLSINFGAAFTDQFGTTIPAGIQSTTGTASAPTVISTDTWHAPSMGTGFGSGPEYILNPDNTVSLRGESITTGNTAANATIFTLPAGYRPNATFAFIVPNNFSGYTSPARVISISTGGVVTAAPAGTSGNFLLLDGIRFPIN